MEWLANETGRELVVATLGAGGGAAGDERNFFAMAEAENGLGLGGGVGKKHGARHGAEIGESVAFVGVELVGGSDEVAGADNLAEFGEEGGVHVGWGKDATVGRMWS